MSDGRLQAKDIDDADVMSAITLAQRPWGVSSIWDTNEKLNEIVGFEVPEKVVLAKLARLIKRGVVSGCPCGCRGDFEVVA